MTAPRMALYVVIALIATMIAYSLLVREPSPGWPTNLIHLLARH